MTSKELIKYLSYANDKIELTVIPTEEYERLRKIEAMAKADFSKKKAIILSFFS